MPEYRILLEGGDVLVVTTAIEDGEEDRPLDPTTLGSRLLEALGLPRATGRVDARPAPRQKIVRPVEPDADTWLSDTSKPHLKAINSGR